MILQKFKHQLIALFLLACLTAAGQNELKITSDFPGGNIVLLKISGDTVWVKPDLTHTEGGWFYWYFKVSGISGKQVTFRFDRNNMFERFGPAYSINNDRTWKWYGENRIADNGFTYRFSKQDTVAFFSMAFPYTEKDLKEFLSGLRNRQLLSVDTLCLTSGKRAVEMIKITAREKIPEKKVLITARHHACEMMASYVLEGIIESVLNECDLAFLREKCEFRIIPFMDKDGVEEGDQGKNRIPRDHNRDYSGPPVHKSTAALREIIPGWSGGKLKFALDIHCPYIGDDKVFTFGPSKDELKDNSVLFSRLLEKYSVGELKFRHIHFVPYGVGYNTSKSYTKGMGFRDWASMINGIGNSETIEFPYSCLNGAMVTKDGARAFGKAVAYAISDCLKQKSIRNKK